MFRHLWGMTREQVGDLTLDDYMRYLTYGLRVTAGGGASG